MTRLFFFFATLVLTLTNETTLRAESTGLDFDGDGISDLVGYEIQSDGSPNEVALTWISSQSRDLVRKEFGKRTEFPVPADYDGDGITDLAVVGPTDDGALLWRMKLSTANDEVSEIRLGTLGDSVLSGCSFDGDNKSDLVLINGQTLFLYRSTDLSGAVFNLGVSELERFYCADVTGDGQVDLIAQKGSAQAATFYAWNMLTNEKVVEVSFGENVGDIFAADINGDGIKELGYSKKSTGSFKKLFFLLNGSVATVTVPNSKKVAVSKSVLGLGNPDTLFLKSPQNDAFRVLSNISTPAVYEEESIFDTQSVMSGVNFGRPGPLRSREAVCNIHNEPTDGPQGFIWKPVSDTTRNVVVILPKAQRLKKVRLVKDGKILEMLRYGGIANGGRAHWRSMKRAASLPSEITVMGQQGQTTHCWLIVDPLQRHD